MTKGTSHTQVNKTSRKMYGKYENEEEDTNLVVVVKYTKR